MDIGSPFQLPKERAGAVYYCAKCGFNTHTPCPKCGQVLTERNKVNLQDLSGRGKPWGGKPNFPEPSELEVTSTQSG